MKPAPFTWHAPSTVADAVAILAETAPDDGRILAGGQSLAPAMAFRLARPAHLVDINGIAGLDRLELSDGVLRIGALVRHAAFEDPGGSDPLRRLLADIVRHIAHYPIRTRGTFCGSLAHADPASEWCVAAVTLDAILVAESVRGTRRIPAVEFLEWAMTTALAPDEMLTGAEIPLLAPGACVGFAEFSRRTGDFALAMALAVFNVDNGVIAAPRLGIGGAEGLPRRVAEAEAALAGRPATPEAFAAAAEAAAAAVDPMEDHHADGDYRRELVRAMTLRALEKAAA